MNDIYVLALINVVRQNFDFLDFKIKIDIKIVERILL